MVRLTSANTSLELHILVKYDILGSSCSAMHGNAIDFGFPSMNEDPFSSSPLGEDEFELLVGRHAMFEEMERKISFKSADRILIVGEFGSGKTSFMQCLGAKTNLHLCIDRVAFSEPGVELLKDMYAQLIDGSPPHDYQKLSRDLERMLHDSRQMLPLITIDADMADVSSLEACLRSSLHFFERLPALIMIAINPQQQSLISEQLLQRFELRTMPNLDTDGIKALVERRISRASTQPYKMSTEDAQQLLKLSRSGQPGALLKILRNAVTGNYTVPSSHLLQKELPAPEPKVEDNEVPVIEDLNADSPIIEESVGQPEDVVDDQESWEETPGMTEASGFDLDFGILDEPVQEPIEVVEEESSEGDEESIDPTYVTEDSLPFAGVFGGLRTRRRIVNEDLATVPEGQYKATEKGTAFWSAEQPLPIVEDETEEESPVSFAEPEVGSQELDSTELFEMQPMQETALDSNTIETFSRLLAQVFQPANTSLSANQDLVEQLRALSRPRFTEKEEHVLSVAVLSSLTSSESVVVAEAKSRTISPSDKALLEQLSIKRARLSQICNRLHKAGILHARMVGRSRMFGLTRTALAQLIAWGIVGGDE